MKPIYPVIFSGDRDWSDSTEVIRTIKRFKRSLPSHELVVIEGGAAGLDQIAGIYAELNDVHVCVVDALWQTRYRGAGPQRNEIMAALGPKEVRGFHENIKASKGTKGMLNIAVRLKIPAQLWDGKRWHVIDKPIR